MHRRLTVIAVAALLLGCESKLPPLEYSGERVNAGSDVVDQVCAGTLRRMDREVEQIETRLALPTQSSRIDVYIVDNDSIETHCEAKVGGCAPTLEGRPSVVIRPASFERGIAHELVHARLVRRTVPFFEEGIAEATSTPSCPRSTPDIELADFLAAKNAVDWPDRRVMYYAAGELVAWLLAKFGPRNVLRLMHSTARGSSSATVRTLYFEHFGRDLASDFLEHHRTDTHFAVLPPEDFGCLAPPVDPQSGPVHLAVDLDCDSDRVHNNFEVDGSGYVEWTLHIDQPQTLELVGDVPSGTSLTIEECRCDPRIGEDEYLLARPFGNNETLQPGAYRLRWVGALDEGLVLDVKLVPTTP
jgi:hypothetical protein